MREKNSLSSRLSAGRSSRVPSAFTTQRALLIANKCWFVGRPFFARRNASSPRRASAHSAPAFAIEPRIAKLCEKYPPLVYSSGQLFREGDVRILGCGSPFSLSCDPLGAGLFLGEFNHEMVSPGRAFTRRRTFRMATSGDAGLPDPDGTGTRPDNTSSSSSMPMMMGSAAGGACAGAASAVAATWAGAASTAVGSLKK